MAAQAAFQGATGFCRAFFCVFLAAERSDFDNASALYTRRAFLLKKPNPGAVPKFRYSYENTSY
jgi:hypothetical protein